MCAGGQGDDLFAVRVQVDREMICLLCVCVQVDREMICLLCVCAG